MNAKDLRNGAQVLNFRIAEYQTLPQTTLIVSQINTWKSEVEMMRDVAVSLEATVGK